MSDWNENCAALGQKFVGFPSRKCYRPFLGKSSEPIVSEGSFRKNPMFGSILRRSLSVYLAIAVCVLSACSSARLRVPTAEERRHYVFSKNLDPALIDANEQGPARIVYALSEGGNNESSTPWGFAREQHDRVMADIQVAGYDESDDGMMMPSMDHEEKGASVMIGTIIIILVLAGAAVPLLFYLDVI